MKFLILFIPLIGFSQNSSNACDSSCSKSPLINKVSFDPPKEINSDGQIILSGEDFPDCAENTSVTMAGKNLQIITIDKNEITAKIDQIDYQDGSYRIQVSKTKCSNKIANMDATIKKTLPPNPPKEFTTRKISNIPIYPLSTMDIEVSCIEDEIAISGGFVIPSTELYLVSSSPDGKVWRFRIYNNKPFGYSANEFYAVCAR